MPDPWWYLERCRELVSAIQAAGVSVENARIMEVGTGWVAQTPINFFLCGANSIVTFDLHRYLIPRFVVDSVKVLASDKNRVVRMLGDFVGSGKVGERLDLISRCASCDEILRTARISYRAPADAAHTDLPDHSINIHISNNVFEHVPPAALKQILLEANRVLMPTGVAIHRFGPSDHFAEDQSILPINFLQYRQEEWDRLADNQFAYHNRLRGSDYKNLYDAAGHQIVEWEPTIHPPSLTALKNGFPLAPEFQGKSWEDLSTVLLRVVSRPGDPTERPLAG